MSKLNPLEHPICFSIPNRLSPIASWHGHIPFAMFLVDVLKPKMIVELGTHNGDSYCAFCQAVKELKMETRCYAVDTWQGDPQSGFYGPNVLADLHAYHDSLYGSFSRLIQSTFDEALSHFNDGTIDILHIDGCHIYEMVKHDFESWLPKVSPQGIILLHDINVLERDYGARKFWDEVNLKYPHFEFLHSHGLGVLAVGKVNPEELRHLFTAKGTEIAEVRDFFSQLGNRITDKVLIESKDREIQSQKNTLQADESKFKGLGIMLEGKSKQIDELGNSLKEKTSLIDTLESDLKEKISLIDALESDIKEKASLIDEINNSLQAKNVHIGNLQIQLYQIQHGILMQLRNKYQNIIENLFRQGTRRRRYYQLALKAVRIILNEGWRSFFQKLGRYRVLKKPVQMKAESSKLKKLPDYLEETIEKINKKVSIVIPTKNAGEDFDFTLEKILDQKGIGEIEIIIVDSGSNDRTLELSENRGAKVFTIRSNEFNHGFTRNYGAEQATGDYILFMVQDAMPIGDHWLFDIINTFDSDNEIAGITCRQIPRSDADLYYSYVMRSHYKFMDLDKDKKIQITKENFMNLSAIEKRKIAGVENVCFCIKTDIFKQFKFKKMDYAEDIDLGIRLIESGYKLQFLYWVGVIHSHTRESKYFLNRNYVNNKSLGIIFKTNPTVIEPNMEMALSEIVYLYNSINNSMRFLSAKYPKDVDIGTFFIQLKENIEKAGFVDASKQKGDNGLDLIFLELGKLCDGKRVKNRILIENFFILLDSAYDYLRNIAQQYETIELSQMVYKLFATWCGWYLGDLYLLESSNGKMQRIDVLLGEGV